VVVEVEVCGCVKKLAKMSSSRFFLKIFWTMILLRDKEEVSDMINGNHCYKNGVLEFLANNRQSSF
jgi:hypothetical protein